jgi:chitodextrinase
MPKQLQKRLRVVTAILLVLVMLAAVSPATAAQDRRAPTTPTNLRVTGMTAYSVSLAWDPSTDNSGSVTYVICCANVSSETFPGPASSHVYRAGLEAGRSFSLRIVARDAAGNYSKYSNTVTFTLPRDVTPPTKPTVSLTDVGPTHVSLAWSAVDDGPNVWFNVYKDGSPVSIATRNSSGTFHLLTPETSYTFTVQARDFGGNTSPMSDPITVTTEASDPNDVTPPTTPTDLHESHFGDGEIHLTWTQSTDDFTQQSFIRYNVFVNGVLSDITVGSGFSIVYNNNPGGGGLVAVDVIAVDTAGNESAPASITINMDLP